MGVVIVLVVLVVLVAAGAVVLNRQRQTVAAGGGGAGARDLSPGAAPTPRRSSVRGVRPGDVVLLDGHDCIVEQTYRLREGGSTWDEHLLVDGDFKRWLSVEDDEGLECVVWERSPSPDLEPGPETVTVAGSTYAFDERGTADYTREVKDGAGSSGRVEYADYEAGDRRLAFERFDGAAWEVSVGDVVSEHLLDVYPASA